MPSTESVLIHIDGAARGNPGPAACGVIVKSVQGKILEEVARPLGRATNNLAEYQALLAALECSLERGYQRVKMYSDSQLLTRQINGEYKVRNADLLPLYRRAREMIARLDSFSITHVPREKNRDADRLANQALDSAADSSPARKKKKQEETLRLTAVYRNGALHPVDAISLDEGEIVELELFRKRSKP